MATLTFNYHDSMAVLGPLATSPEPHTYDLCEGHATNLTVPVGWQIVRLQTTYEPAPPSSDDLLALVDAVRAAARSEATVRRREAHPVSDHSVADNIHDDRAPHEGTYATVTQLRPAPADADTPGRGSSSFSTSQPPSTPPVTSSRSALSSHPAVASQKGAGPRSAAEHVARELGPFAQPRPTMPEENSTDAPAGH